MAIKSYNQSYLSNAMNTMAVMLDYAVNTKGCDIDYFFNLFIGSGVAYGVENGNPMYITGKNGIELYQVVTGDYNYWQYPSQITGRSCEYWIGWMITYYQWHSSKSFGEITSVMPLSKMRLLYPTLHEADLSRSVEYLDSLFAKSHSRLRTIREQRGLTQELLSRLSNVPASTIRNYENNPTAINNAQINILISLARTLNCNPTDFLSSYDYNTNMPNNSMDSYRKMVIEETNRKIAEIEQQRQALQNNQQQYSPSFQTYTSGYFAQLPYNYATATSSSNLQVNKNEFLNNWNSYWLPITEANSTNARDREQARKDVIQAGGLALDIFATASQNQTAKIVADAYGIATADSLSKAVLRTISIIKNLQK